MADLTNPSFDLPSYSLLILDNPNLQDLWLFENDTIDGKKRIQVLNGRIFFHLNPQLCYNKIKQMTDYVEINQMILPWDERDVSPHSNGDKVPCEVHKLKASLWGVAPEIVGIKWENFKYEMEDQRSLLGYLIYYREA